MSRKKISDYIVKHKIIVGFILTALAIIAPLMYSYLNKDSEKGDIFYTPPPPQITEIPIQNKEVDSRLVYSFKNFNNSTLKKKVEGGANILIKNGSSNIIEISCLGELVDEGSNTYSILEATFKF